MGLVLLLVFGTGALALPGGLVLVLIGGYRVSRGRKQKSRKGVLLGIGTLVAGLVATLIGVYAVMWLSQAGISLDYDLS